MEQKSDASEVVDRIAGNAEAVFWLAEREICHRLW
jgi:hypothetical protein